MSTEPVANQPNPDKPEKKPLSEEELIRLITERVWELLKEDLRREQERLGGRYATTR